MLLRITVATALALVASPAFAQETRASAIAKLDAEFKATDTDGNGTLSLAEVSARMGKMSAGTQQLDPVHAKRVAGLWFQSADRNKDGKVTRDESRALMIAVFDRYDIDHDGKITPIERAKAAEAAKAGAGQ
jgi:Ca2+-binding EF-hand superfamily protein